MWTEGQYVIIVNGFVGWVCSLEKFAESGRVKMTKIMTIAEYRSFQKSIGITKAPKPMLTPMAKPIIAGKAAKVKPVVPKQSAGEVLFIAQCKAHKLTPVMEYRFHPTRRWRLDFAWPDIRLAVEIEGGTWGVSRHTTGTGFAEDCVKYNAAVALGWRVLRYTTGYVKDGSAIRDVLEIIA